MSENLVNQMAAYRVRGVVSQADTDQGDTLNRTGVYYACLAALGLQDDKARSAAEGLRQDLELLAGSEPGRFRRGNDEARWFYNENNVTRDQMIPVQAAMALAGLTDLARTHFKLRARRLFFHFSSQNDGADAGPLIHKTPDIPSPDEFGSLIRATRYKLLYFLLPLCDLWLLLMVKYGRSQSKRSLWDSDNQLVPTVLAALDQPTFVTKYVRRAYAQTDAAYHLRYYNSEANGANGIEPLGELCVLAFERCIGGLKT